MRRIIFRSSFFCNFPSVLPRLGFVADGDMASCYIIPTIINFDFIWGFLYAHRLLHASPLGMDGRPARTETVASPLSKQTEISFPAASFPPLNPLISPSRHFPLARHSYLVLSSFLRNGEPRPHQQASCRLDAFSVSLSRPVEPFKIWAEKIIKEITLSFISHPLLFFFPKSMLSHSRTCKSKTHAFGGVQKTLYASCGV